MGSVATQKTWDFVAALWMAVSCCSVLVLWWSGSLSKLYSALRKPAVGRWNKSKMSACSKPQFRSSTSHDCMQWPSISPPVTTWEQLFFWSTFWRQQPLFRRFKIEDNFIVIPTKVADSYTAEWKKIIIKHITRLINTCGWKFAGRVLLVQKKQGATYF